MSMPVCGTEQGHQQSARGHLPLPLPHACSSQHRCCALAAAAQHRRLKGRPALKCTAGSRQRMRLGVTALAPGMCFDAECQAAMDRAFLIATLLPLLGLAGAIGFRLRPAHMQKRDGKQVFEDPSTGVVFEAAEGRAPEKDRKGELAFKAVSYTPWPVEAGAEGDRVRVAVGPVNACTPRTYVFPRVLPQPSQIVAVTLPRPVGVVFEEDARRGRVAVAGFVEGSPAGKRAKVARLDRVMAGSSLLPGDVLRGVTCTNFVYPTQALFGAQAPRRTIVLYGADNQRWPKVAAALRKGDRADGCVTIVVERQLEREAVMAGEKERARPDY